MSSCNHMISVRYFFQVRASTPPTTPRMAPKKKPPIPKRLTIEKASISAPQVDVLDGWL